MSSRYYQISITEFCLETMTKSGILLTDAFQVICQGAFEGITVKPH